MKSMKNEINWIVKNDPICKVPHIFEYILLVHILIISFQTLDVSKPLMVLRNEELVKYCSQLLFAALPFLWWFLAIFKPR